MSDKVQVGVSGEYEMVVTVDVTARHLGSGGVDVFGTPYMILAMEAASVHAIDALLPEGHMSVGIHVDVRHLKATPVGQTVRARSEVVEVNGKRVTFRVQAWDEKQLIGEGTHKRAIVELARFEQGLKAAD